MKLLADRQRGFAAEAFQLQPALDVAEGFFDAPALLVQLAEDAGRIQPLIQQRNCLHLDLAGGQHHPHQLQPERCQRQPVLGKSRMVRQWLAGDERAVLCAADKGCQLR